MDPQLAVVLAQIDFAQIPFEKSRNNERSNFMNPESLSYVGNAIILSTWPLMVILLTLRLYVRARVTRSLGLDDLLCALAASTMTAISGISLYLFKTILGHHSWDIRLVDVTPHFLGLLPVLQYLYYVAALFAKSSILIFHLRIFKPNKSARVIIYGFLGLVTVYYLTSIIYTAIICRPQGSKMSSDFDITQMLDGVNLTSILQQPGQNVTDVLFELVVTGITEHTKDIRNHNSCSMPPTRLSAVSGVFNLFTDLCILILSIAMTLRLRLSVRKRAGLCAVFLIGLLACGFSALTCYYRIQSVLTMQYDFTWSSVLSLSTGIAEVNIGVLCSCVPSLPILFKRLIHSDTWNSIKYMISNRRKGSKSSDSARSQDPQSSPAVPARRWLKVSVARGAMTGLRTLIRGDDRPETITMDSSQTYDDLTSVNDDYHQYIGNGHKSAALLPTPDRSVSGDTRD
ncbi:hypothetical protein PFICI_07720 [Pestalotiopsis fici W106-1]|uniref:Rhodopsin domain-containing protein n=1 Tax=Pestalotiopsis fici (strain W106-1 / CGMCC3.15140) TaxID=1229662 RepID=W3X4T8_PESFW|nr:uncharacterized protein PFICI_07720 [Pestalotiopsis fici W106-1]ETS80191.1 hypothetical protein PFICI_07720 [Pestalotiopsis fici W106-1]